MANLTKEQKNVERSVRPYRKANAQRRAKFLRALARTGNVTHSAQHSGISTRNIYQYAKKNKRFANRMDEARAAFRASLENEAVRRGRDGFSKPVFQGGELVGFEQRYSDRLLETVLRANDPDKYGKQTIEHTGDVNAPIALTAVRSAKPLDVDAMREANSAAPSTLTLFEEGGE